MEKVIKKSAAGKKNTKSGLFVSSMGLPIFRDPWDRHRHTRVPSASQFPADNKDTFVLASCRS